MWIMNKSGAYKVDSIVLSLNTIYGKVGKETYVLKTFENQDEAKTEFHIIKGKIILERNHHIIEED